VRQAESRRVLGAAPGVRDRQNGGVPTVSLPGVTVYYERVGSGPPLLLIGGTGGDLRREPSPLSWPGGEQFEQLAYDQRGLGRSLPDDPGAQPTMADFAADALALADAVGWGRFAIVGISFGGMVAQEVAIRAPHRISRLILIGTSSGGAGGDSAPLHEVLEMGPPRASERMLELLDVRSREDRRVRMALAMRQTPVELPLPDGLARQLEARRHHDTWERLGAIAAPTLVAAGRYDALAPPANSERLAAAIPGARLAVFDGGHHFLMQDPTAWPALVRFLST
jgi:3-oxoadipate enol-lactonase